jgi:hypothetical protein
MPAIRRYQSARIEKVYTAAAHLGLGFYILSGQFGLTPPQQPLPFYDHLLPLAEVPSLAELVARQLHEYGVSSLIYFTRPLASSADLIPYHDALVAACHKTALPYFVVEWAEEPLSPAQRP